MTSDPQKMKRKILLACLAALPAIVCAQTIPNGNFEKWDSDSFDMVKFYPTNSNKDLQRIGMPFNCERSTDAFHGSYAVKLTTREFQGQPLFGYFLNTSPEDGEPEEWHGGMPYTEKPTGIRGYYKSNIPAGDTALVIVSFSKNGANVGSYTVKLVGQHSTYTLFDMVFSPALGVTPDSVIFGATSSNVFIMGGINGSMLLLDSVSFKGVSSQPATFNSDFEEWETEKIEIPQQWYSQGGPEVVVKKSTDAYQGDFGARIESSLIDWDGQMRAISGSLGTGYYPVNCNPCDLAGGHSFTSMNDTLVFWYKYTAAAGSKGSGYYMLRENGNVVGGDQFEIEPSATFLKMEVPIIAFQTPDTLVVDFQSLRWTDSLPLQAAAVLIIDEVHLKSQPLSTGLFRHVKTQLVNVYPNPASGSVNMEMERAEAYPGTTIRLVNNLGQTVHISEMSGSNHRINLEGLPAGAYYYLLESGGQKLQSGKLIVQY